MGEGYIKIKRNEETERKVKNDGLSMTRKILSVYGRERGIEVEIERPPHFQNFAFRKVYNQSVVVCISSPISVNMIAVTAGIGWHCGLGAPCQ